MASQQITPTQCMVWGRGEDGWLPCQIVNTGNENMPAVSLKSVSQVCSLVFLSLVLFYLFYSSPSSMADVKGMKTYLGAQTCLMCSLFILFYFILIFY
jgi:hypothetical protein